MKLIWHIIRKDLARFRWPLIGWLALIAAKNALFMVAAGTFGPTWVELLVQAQNGPVHLILFGLEPLTAFFLTAAVAFEDAPVGGEPWWVTRPISGVRLGTAKLLGLGLMIVVPQMVIPLPWWVSAGFGWEQLGSFAVGFGSFYLLLAVLGLGAAVLTGSYPRFILWTPMALLAFVLLHGFALTIFGREAAPITNISTLIFDVLVLLAGMAAVALVIAYQRYVTRFFRWALVTRVALTALASAIIFAILIQSPQALGRRQPPEIAAPAGIRVTAKDRPYWISNQLRLRLHTEQPRAHLVTGLVSGTWRADDGRIWRRRNWTSNLVPRERALRELLGESVEGIPPWNPLDFNLLRRPIPGKVLRAATSFEASGKFYVSELFILDENPVAAGVHRFPGGSYTLSDLTLRDGELSVLLTLRTAAQFRPFLGLSGFVVANRTTGEHFQPSSVDTKLTNGFSQIGLVPIQVVRLRFRLPPQPGLVPRPASWFDQAHFVVIGERSLGQFSTDLGRQTFAPQTDPRPNALEDYQTLFRPADDAMNAYFGNYAAAPGVVLSLSAGKSGLQISAPGMREVRLLSIAPDRFQTAHWMGNDQRDLLDVEFQRDPQGQINGFLLRQNGRDYLIPRISP